MKAHSGLTRSKRLLGGGGFFLAAGICAMTLSGCGTGNSSSGAFPTAHAASGSAAASSPVVSVKGISPASAPAVLNAIEMAYQEYLAAYEKYVRLLRESGPQTIETLQALAEYQKKYQLYQRMLASTQGTGNNHTNTDP
ncbi:MAG: hypothetical protein WA705_03765 [Candidatus Ozemobacteraceae bacterium]